MRSTVLLAAALLLVVAVHRSEATFECPSALSYINSGYVFLKKYDAVNGYNDKVEDGVVGDLSAVGTVITNIIDAINTCDAKSGACLAFNYIAPSDKGYVSFFKGPAAGYTNYDVAKLRLRPAEDKGPEKYFTTECTGIFVSIKGASANVKSCFYNNQDSPEGLKNCLLCVHKAGLDDNQRTQCSGCVGNLRGAKMYTNADMCPDCAKSDFCECLYNNQKNSLLAATWCPKCRSDVPDRYGKCKDCIVNLRDSKNVEPWTQYCASPSCGYQCIDCLVNNKDNTNYVVNKCLKL